MKTPFFHEPVMLRETVDSLGCGPGGVYFDGTLGGGGHAYEILVRTAPDGVLVGVDRDSDALSEARRRLGVFEDRIRLVKGNFADIGDILSGLGIEKVDGILLDLGVSSHQLDTPDRGFSFSMDAPLDMRMDREVELTAFDVVNGFPEERLKKLIKEYGEEMMPGRIVRAISERRKLSPIKTTGELAAVIARALPGHLRNKKIHPATKTFQAIRIAVNDELANLHRAIENGIDMLERGGRFSIISFHSLEDRMVKNAFRSWERGCICPPDFPVCRCNRSSKVRVPIKRAVVPGDAEIASNPRARSARLRTAVRI
ncbi:MAG TPA: 16S rRNA (cytosine(1402)-N(4))-methyltransferase RsmH [Syntrophales bacterium]|nr:16S rRNA (cytosine(1402)-N(4))-methyltransferase RsmH [Syntrophales bacterium]HPQ43443.1 16S rRNA (cytosine(1402)-N(4))-methyltransferase RsmH [Syntrophales bacterium]